MLEILPQHKKRFEEIKRELSAIGSKESGFIKVELLFYEVITASRNYGDDVSENNFLAALKNLQSGVYQDTKEHFKKNTRREQVIKKFINQFKMVLSSAIKNGF